MFRGKYGAASAFLSEEKTSGVLGENDVLPSGETVPDALKSKHPSAHAVPKPRSGCYNCIILFILYAAILY